MIYPKIFKRLIDHFASLPSIGPKMAERLVLHLFSVDKERLADFAQSIAALQNLSRCRRCFNVADDTLCAICRDKNRDQKKICVVEEPLDAIPIERTRAYDGLYHILGGTLESSNEENGDITIPQLLERVRKDGAEEVIIATNFTTEGDVTALYLKRALQPLGVKITRLARGLSTGGDIEYADDITLRAALTNRADV